MMKTKCAVIVISTFSACSAALADVPFETHQNGDLTIKVMRINERHLAELRRDIPGKQGSCVRAMILDIQGYEMKDAIMRIPYDRHGIEFETKADKRVRYVCGRFTEDWYDYDGNLTSSTEYEEINGY